MKTITPQGDQQINSLKKFLANKVNEPYSFIWKLISTNMENANLSNYIKFWNSPLTLNYNCSNFDKQFDGLSNIQFVKLVDAPFLFKYRYLRTLSIHNIKVKEFSDDINQLLNFYHDLHNEKILKFYGIAYSFQSNQELQIGLLEEKVKSNLHQYIQEEKVISANKIKYCSFDQIKKQLSTKISIFNQILTGVQFLIKKNIYITGLTTNQIFLTSKKQIKIRIIDQFQNSKYFQETKNRNKSQLIPMNPPEFISTGKIDEKGYAWNLGIILFELFYYEVLEKRKNLSINYLEDCLHPLNLPNNENLIIPEEITKLISNCLKLNEKDRINAKNIELLSIDFNKYEKQLNLLTSRKIEIKRNFIAANALNNKLFNNQSLKSDLMDYLI